MANESIYAAFERMWQHVIAKFNEITKPDPILDKTSENPIMNKAVAEALEDLSASGGFVVQAEPPEDKRLLWVDTDDESEEVENPQGGGGTPAWELVADITIEEEVKNLTISENMAGQPLSMKAMYMYMYIPASENSTQYFRMSLNNGYNQYAGQQGISANALHERHMKIETDGLGNAFITYSLARTNIYTGRNPDAQYGSYKASANGGMPLGAGKTTIEKINFPEITFPVGSIIKIYKVV